MAREENVYKEMHLSHIKATLVSFLLCDSSVRVNSTFSANLTLEYVRNRKTYYEFITDLYGKARADQMMTYYDKRFGYFENRLEDVAETLPEIIKHVKPITQ